jgi:hypothetical protein
MRKVATATDPPPGGANICGSSVMNYLRVTHVALRILR